MNMEYGEVVEVYTVRAVLQLQRETKTRKGGCFHTMNMTIAPIENRKANFEKKIVIQLEENQLASFCQAMMGLLKSVKIDGAKVQGDKAKVAYININDDETVNINISDSESNIPRQSIVFSPDYRYQLLRIAVSQLTKNSKGYEQTIADTLNILKASAIGRRV